MAFATKYQGSVTQHPMHYRDAQFDEDGFLQDPGAWDETLAREIAARDGIEGLSEDHFRVINYVRAHHLECGSLPCLRHVGRALGLGDHWVGLHFGSSGKELWRVAGLENPGEEAKAYM